MAASADPAAPAAASAPEAYRLRIQNIQHGAVDISLDRGRSWRVVARVVQAATGSAARPGSALGRVTASSDTGITLGVAAGRCVRMLPDAPAARKDPAAVVLSCGRGEGPFGTLRPAALSVMLEEAYRRITPLPADYAPQEGDVLHMIMEAPPAGVPDLAQAVAALASVHERAALERISRVPGQPVTGVLTVLAKVGQVPPASVSVIMETDCGQTAILSSAPYEVRWDTRSWPDGEHVIEARSIDTNGKVLRRNRTLVFVRNTR